MSSTLLCGVYRADITPAVGGTLYGYLPNVYSTSLHDPLYATALALTQNNETVILVSLTLCDFRTDYCDILRAYVAKEIGLPIERLIVSLTHTHSAPNVGGAAGWGDVDVDYFNKILCPMTAKACKTALENQKDAEMAIGTTRSYVGVNRRNYDLYGKMVMNQNPWGYLDPTMTVISFREPASKKGIFNLIHYGCHGTAAGMNHEITRDWSGVMEDRMTKLTGTPSAFYNGPFGDVGPRLTNGDTTGDITYVEELGGVAAQDAKRAYDNLGSYSVPKLTIIEGEIPLPYAPLPSLEEIAPKLTAQEHPEQLEGLDATLYTYAKEIEAIYREGKTVPTELILPQTLVCIGDVVFFPAPFELFSETALKLRQFAPCKHALTLSNANGYYSYLPAQHEICHGGYEVDSFLYHGALSLRDDTEQTFVRENIHLLTKHLSAEP